MRYLHFCLVAVFFVLAANAALAQDPTATHPLDPLTPNEFAQVLSILKAANVADNATLYPMITLREPDKGFVLSWVKGEPIPRSAFVIAKQSEQTFEGVVNLSEGRLESWEEVAGVQPSILLSEGFEAQQRVLANPEFQAGLAKRGITNLGSACLASWCKTAPTFSPDPLKVSTVSWT
jgi:primary-amine oxidase